MALSRRSLRAVGAVALALALPGCGRKEEAPDAARWLSLEIERPEPAGHPSARLPEPKVDEDGFVTKSFLVPPGFNSHLFPAESQPVDPFASPESENPPSKKLASARNVLESCGVVFGPGASAVFQPDTSRVIVRQTPEQMALVEAIIYSIKWTPPHAITFRVEIYELPDRLAIPLVRSAGPRHDHSPEHRAVAGWLGDGEAVLVQSANLTGRSGQRFRFEDGYEIIRGSSPEFRWAEGTEDSAPWRMGTLLEVSAVIGQDDATIDVNLTLEILTEASAKQRLPPTLAARSPAGGTPVRIPGFTRRTLRFKGMVRDGEIRLIGTWSPGREGRDGGAGARHLVFLHATRTRPYSLASP